MELLRFGRARLRQLPPCLVELKLQLRRRAPRLAPAAPRLCRSRLDQRLETLEPSALFETLVPRALRPELRPQPCLRLDQCGSVVVRSCGSVAV